jgi:hypothetical protein
MFSRVLINVNIYNVLVYALNHVIVDHVMNHVIKN